MTKKNKNLVQTVLILISFTIFYPSYCWAISEPIFIELGQNFKPKRKISKIWIENQKVLSAENSNQGLTLKSQSIGETFIRINDDEPQKVYITSISTNETLKLWTKLSSKFLDVHVDLCENYVCLKGTLFRTQDYEKIVDLIKKNHSSIFFAMKISADIEKNILSSIDNYLRSRGLTPLKVNTTDLWKMQYSSKELSLDYKNSLEKIGILAVENKQKLELADNIKVSIQVTELKKEFGRTLGVSWPGSYSAQVVDNKILGPETFDAQVLANEKNGYLKVLASPNLLCRSGKEAEFFAGGEFPIKILNFKVNDVVWKKYGINLKVKPQIDATGQMSIQIDSEVSSLDKSVSVDGIPGLHTHRVSSYFDLIKSKTIALSGLLMSEEGKSTEGLPFLKNIPILGRLFSSDDYRENKTELVIFVTPELMKQQD